MLTEFNRLAIKGLRHKSPRGDDVALRLIEHTQLFGAPCRSLECEEFRRYRELKENLKQSHFRENSDSGVISYVDCERRFENLANEFDCGAFWVFYLQALVEVKYSRRSWGQYGLLFAIVWAFLLKLFLLILVGVPGANWVAAGVFASFLTPVTTFPLFFHLMGYGPLRARLDEMRRHREEMTEIVRRHSKESAQFMGWHNKGGELALIGLRQELEAKKTQVTGENAPLRTELKRLEQFHKTGLECEETLKLQLVPGSTITTVEREMFEVEYVATCENNETLARGISALKQRLAQFDVCIDACIQRLCMTDGPLYRLSILERAAENRLASTQALERAETVVNETLQTFGRFLASVDADVARLRLAAEVNAVTELADGMLTCEAQLRLIGVSIDENLAAVL